MVNTDSQGQMEFVEPIELQDVGEDDGSKVKQGMRGPDRGQRKRRAWAIHEQKHFEILKLLGEGRGIHWVAQAVGVGVQTVQRRAAIVRRADDEPETVDFHRVKLQRCPEHGAVTIWPCVQCSAEQERKRQTLRN